VNLGTCIHWNGLRGDDTRCCDAGVNYHKAFNGEKPGMFLRMPCRVFDERPAHGRGTYIKAGEPVRAPPCEQWARRCTPTGQSALCVAGEWVPDNTTEALRCER
jgi:hypothetical protein